jgi:hypothetical protein
MLELAKEAVRSGMPVEEMCLSPTYNQRCKACGLHHGWACVCTSEEKKEAVERLEEKMQTPWFTGKWDSANLQTDVANSSDTKSANQSSLQTDSANCACGKRARPRGTDCWKCYRAR